jgi:ABC-type thiamine transport system substrate-binding protein
VIKISIWKDKSILLIAYNVYTFAGVVKQFDNADLAASFIDFMVEQEEI